MKTLENTANDAWADALGSVVHSGIEIISRGMNTKELINNTMVVDMTYPEVNLPERELNIKFRAAEAAWILSGDNRVDTISKYCKAYKAYSDDQVFMGGAYGPPVVDQLPYIARELGNDMYSRRAVLTIWRPRPYPSRDVPCTVSLQWLIRDDQLHCIANMRSNDVWLGTPYDIFTFSMISHYIIAEFKRSINEDMGPGVLYLNAASLHLYEGNWKDGEDAYQSIDNILDMDSFWKGNNFVFDNGRELIDFLWEQANS